MYEIWLFNCSWNRWVCSTTRLPKYVIHLLPSFLLWVTYLYVWFLAETLKYLSLLFDDTNSFKWEEWVLDTEAHPLFQREVEHELFVVDKPGNIVRS